MTLTKAIEAAREALKDTIGYIGDKYSEPYYPLLSGQCKDALAALPDNPMTEDELIKAVMLSVGRDIAENLKERDVMSVIRALKDKNVLYMEEKS